MTIAYFAQNREGIYLNITNRCTNKCVFCLKNFPNEYDFLHLYGGNEPDMQEILEEIEKLIGEAGKEGRKVEEICFCGYGEPLLRFWLVESLIPELKKYGIVRIDTNGQVKLWEKNAAQKLKLAGLDKISISLNAQDSSIYNKLCRPRAGIKAYESMLEFIRECKSLGIDTEVSAVEIPAEKMPAALQEFAPDMEKIKAIASDLGVKFRKRKYLGSSLEEILL